MRALRLGFVLLAFSCAVALAQAPTAAPAPAFRVIVHTRNPVTTLSRETAANMFLRKTTRWSDGSVVKPVDQSFSSVVRSKFSDGVVKRSVAAVRSYWQQLIFAGRDVPPPELESDAAVLTYVSTHDSAIGYVSGTADVTRVKVVSIK